MCFVCKSMLRSKICDRVTGGAFANENEREKKKRGESNKTGRVILCVHADDCVFIRVLLYLNE